MPTYAGMHGLFTTNWKLVKCQTRLSTGTTSYVEFGPLEWLNQLVFIIIIDSLHLLFLLHSVLISACQRGLFTGKFSAGRSYRQKQFATVCSSHWHDTTSRLLVYTCVLFVWHISAII